MWPFADNELRVACDKLAKIVAIQQARISLLEAMVFGAIKEHAEQHDPRTTRTKPLCAEEGNVVYPQKWMRP